MALDLNEVARLTWEASEISRIKYVMDIDEEKANKILDS